MSYSASSFSSSSPFFHSICNSPIYHIIHLLIRFITIHQSPVKGHHSLFSTLDSVLFNLIQVTMYCTFVVVVHPLRCFIVGEIQQQQRTQGNAFLSIYISIWSKHSRKQMHFLPAMTYVGILLLLSIYWTAALAIVVTILRANDFYY